MTVTIVIAIPVAVLALTLLLVAIGCEFTPGSVSTPTAIFDSTVTGIPSLVAFWHLDEGSGPTAVDNFGGHDGTYNSGPVPAGTDSAAAPGTLNFGQSSLISNESAKQSIYVEGAFVEVPFTADLNTAQFTIQAWVKTDWTPADTTAYRAVIFNEQSETGVARGFSLYANPANTWEVFVADGTAFHSVAADGPISLGTTDYLTATYDGTTLTLYVNGEKRGQAALAYQPNTSHPFAIGQGIPGPFNPAFPFKGQLEEITYFNTALDNQTIVNIGMAAIGMHM
jgi:hypothetical protein